jgi:hypothetical protein
MNMAVWEDYVRFDVRYVAKDMATKRKKDITSFQPRHADEMT